MDTHNALVLQAVSERAFEHWYLPLRPPHLAPHKLALHDFVVSYIGADANVCYLEFGVHTGAAIQRFSSRFVNPNARFVGFDSFTGLPEDWGSIRQGHFSTDGVTPSTSDARITFVTGWFQNSVRTFLPEFHHDGPVLVHFDADLYSSTLFLLTSLWWHVSDYFFVFDEFIGHELAALRTFVSAFPVEVEFYSRTEGGEGHPLQIFGRLRTVPMIVNGIG